MTTTKVNSQTDTDCVDQTSYSLIKLAKRNDSDAWERLVKLYSPLVYFWCQESGLPQPDLHDIFQDIFHTLARKIGKFESIENGTFRGWLRTMTRNKLNDHFRKAGREPQPIGGTDAKQYFDQIPAVVGERTKSGRFSMRQSESEIQNNLLCQALSNVRHHFTEQTWKAFWMVVIDGRETIDVAQDLVMRPGTVRVAKSRVLKRLRQELEPFASLDLESDRNIFTRR